jgi:inositol-phosphate phosphatase / L-galactose 1-phosphate phosphatase / histidinol-phosphatase
LASGHVDLILETGLSLFDDGTLVPVVIGAGGSITDWDGQESTLHSTGGGTASATAELHRQALDTLNL